MVSGIERKYFMLGGKGGVGKTTCAATLAVKFANHGHPTLVVSTDPAHSLSDSFDQDFTGGALVPVQGVEAPLYALEINPEKTREEFRATSQLHGSTGVKNFMDNMSLRMLADQLGELKLGELLDTPPLVKNKSFPRWMFSPGASYQLCGGFWPVFLIANIAALIASGAMTTATFSYIKQSAALGCFPRPKIVHTSRKFMGQIYIPVMNWFLLALSLVLVCSISSIYEIGNAYALTMFIRLSRKQKEVCHWHWTWDYLSPSDLMKKYPHLVIVGTGLVFRFLVEGMILAHLCDEPKGLKTNMCMEWLQATC